MLASDVVQQVLLEELRYNESPGFGSYSPSLDRGIPHIGHVYSVQNIPVVYISQLNDHDPEMLWNLHKSVWNESKVPILYVVLPQEILVYNCYETPSEELHDLNSSNTRLLQHLQHLTDTEVARQTIQNTLCEQGYDRLHLETGAFWSTDEGRRINRQNRADQRLLQDMDETRRRLMQELVPENYYLAYALLGRSIFIRYLEDRNILHSDWVAEATGGTYISYLDVLHDHTATLRVFKHLSKRFNGDLFPVDEQEERYVTQKHLDLLRDFLQGNISGQLSFWPYDFKHIPIELISSIYDTFLSAGQRKELGAYYTPLPLVDVVLNETLPREKVQSDMTILDPACGSGVFLVRAYQKLVDAWKVEHDTKEPTADHLAAILKQSIFGVDKLPEAVYIAAFSLYLAMLDQLPADDIQAGNFRFPSLKGTNLIHADFFSLQMTEQFATRRFDRIIGNPPWGRGTLQGNSLNWIKATGHPVSRSKHIAQAFLWRVPELCADDGEIALLAPAKSTVLMASELGADNADAKDTFEEMEQQFREEFLSTYDIRAIINFSALRYELFSESLSPVTAMFYTPKSPEFQRKIVYGVPKPSDLSQRLGAIVLDRTEVKYLSRDELFSNPTLWKIALWGSLRDAAFINRLQSRYTSLGDQEKPVQPQKATHSNADDNSTSLEDQQKLLNWTMSEGYIVGDTDKAREASWLTGKPFVQTRKLNAYVTLAHGIVQEKKFERPRIPDIYQGPVVLIHRSSCHAAFQEMGFIAYRDKISGVAGSVEQIPLLKWLVAYINSPLARYYHFMTSTSWAVERDTIIHNEYKQMPFLVPERDDPRLQEVIKHVDEIIRLTQEQQQSALNVDQQDIDDHQKCINSLVYEMYELNEAERDLVEDTLKYGIGFFEWSKRKNRQPGGTDAVRPPTDDMLRAYAAIFVETVTTLMRYQGKTMNATVYSNQDRTPLNVISFDVVAMSDAKEPQCVEQADELRKHLRYLDKLLLEQHAPALYMRRHVRIYDSSTVHLVRPSEQRFWSRSQARADADNFIADLLRRPQREVGGSAT